MLGARMSYMYISDAAIQSDSGVVQDDDWNKDDARYVIFTSVGDTFCSRIYHRDSYHARQIRTPFRRSKHRRLSGKNPTDTKASHVEIGVVIVVWKQG